MSKANRVEIKRKLEAIERKARREALRDGLLAPVRRVAERIAADAPRDTGKLAESVRVRAGSAARRFLTASVTVGDPHGKPVAFWQEFGTAAMPAHPFIRPNVLDGAPEIARDVEQALRSAVR